MKNILTKLKALFLNTKKVILEHKKISIGLGTSLVVLIIAITIFTGKNSINNVNLDSIMGSLSEKYYEENLKGNVTGINKYIITINDMEKAGIDTTVLVNKEAKCEKGSYSEVLVENPGETDPNKVKYKIENYLECNLK